nr:MAG TPA: hypothetical protein [Caudoviricetes sp.]
MAEILEFEYLNVAVLAAPATVVLSAAVTFTA